MPEDIKAIDQEKVTDAPKFGKDEWDHIAKFIKEELQRRKTDPNRKHLEKVWKEVDRQLRMEPDIRFKMISGTNRRDPTKGWMPEMELPLQSQTLETLTADARRMLKPDSGPFFSAHAAVTDEWLRVVEREDPLRIAGDEGGVESTFGQASADRLVESWLGHFHGQYDFWATWDILNGEAFKYGTFAGRAKNVTKKIMIETSRGVISSKQRFPVLLPRSMKETYLDDRPYSVMNEGVAIGPAQIWCVNQRLEDIVMAAKDGKTEPDDEDGGWMPDALMGVEADKKSKTVQIIEYEGDLIAPKKDSGSYFLPNAIATVLVDKAGPRVIRFRWRKTPFSSYLTQPYHIEDMKTPYGVGPLMMGMPVAKAAAESLNRFMQAAILNTEPPLQYDSDDASFAAAGGPIVAPREKWPTMANVKAVEIGDVTALQSAYLALISQYYDVTGVNQPRLGQTTKSHTTAFAKDAELQRGVARTVDYGNTVIDSPMTKWLDMEYHMSKAVKGEQLILMDGVFMEIKASQMPEFATFQAFGAGGPAEKREKQATKLAALAQAAQIDQVKLGTGGKPMDYEAMQREILREGGWTDVEQFFPAESPGGVPANASPTGTVQPNIITGPGAQSSALG